MAPCLDTGTSYLKSTQVPSNYYYYWGEHIVAVSIVSQSQAKPSRAEPSQAKPEEGGGGVGVPMDVADRTGLRKVRLKFGELHALQRQARRFPT